MMKDEPLEEYKSKLDLKPIKTELPKAFKKICCPNCESEVNTSNLNIKDKIGMCDDCNIVFPFDEEIEDLLSQKGAKQTVLRPEGIEIFEFQNELDISLEQPYVAQEMIPTFFFSMFSFIFLMISLTEGLPKHWVGVALVGTFWAVTAFLLQRMFNRSKHKIHINIDDQYISVNWRPKKLVKDKEYDINEIDQVYVKKNSMNQICVYILVHGADGAKHISLINDLKSRSKAAYLEQEIERHLGITDRRVPDEMS